MFLNVSKDRLKNRRSLEIVGDVLSIASVKVRKTRIMYQANLSYTQLEKYLKILLNGGLIQRGEDSHYLVTEKGREFLKFYLDYLERRSRVSKEIEGTERDKLLLENMCFNGENNCRRKAIREDVEA